MAHKKGEGSTANGRDSHSKRLGVKLFGGQIAVAGNIIVRQRGTKFHPGEGVGLGKDHTIFATTDGVVQFRRRKNERCYVNIIPFEESTAQASALDSAKAQRPVAEKRNFEAEENAA